MKKLILSLLAVGLLSTIPVKADLIKIDGSSTVFPITEAMAEDFQKFVKGKTNVTVGISGTGGGFKKFCRGDIDISNASRPISKSEIEACTAAGIKFYELPIAFDAITVVVNPQNQFLTKVTVAELKKIWSPDAQARVKTWKQVNTSWPDMPLNLFGPGADSGTFDYFTEAIVGKAKSSRGDYTASEDDNVLVQGVARSIGGLGYFGYAYYIENQDKLKAIAIVNDKGQPVLPSYETVINGSYNPLARPIFIYVNDKSYRRPEVQQFIAFYFKNAKNLVTEVKYVPLPDKIYAHNSENLQKNRVGTKFGGVPKIGLTIDELIALEIK